MEYNFKKIEKKWQAKWAKEKLYEAKEDPKKDKFYCLIEFPYPSGEGLHVGHPRSYTALDIVARKNRMQGKNVLYPIGWDAFGLPAENYAIKTGIQPAVATEKNIKNFTRQLRSLGFSFDWSREINTTDPEYYKWTQWMFLQFFKHGLAYKDKIAINWCTKCKIGLANEEVVNGVCERCGGTVEKRMKEQWMIKITKYAERLLEGLKKVDYSPRIKEGQINWIGKSEGAEVDFQVVFASEAKQSRDNGIAASPSAPRNDIIKVFTTRPDTLFGATYMVLAPEHELVEKMKAKISNWNEVERYIGEAKRKSDLERTMAWEKVPPQGRDARISNRIEDSEKFGKKTGVELKGVKAINPVNNEEIPIWVADYVLTGYGTGAIMAVPAHDERDFAFATKFYLPIRQVVAPELEAYMATINLLKVLKEIYDEAKKRGVKFWLWGALACAFYARIIYRGPSDLDFVVRDNDEREKLGQILEKFGFKKVEEKKVSDQATNFIYKNKEGVEIDVGLYAEKFSSGGDDFESEEKELNGFHALVISKKFEKNLKEWQVKNRDKKTDIVDMEYLNGKVFVDEGFAVNSDFLDGLPTAEAKEKITKWLEEKKIGKKTVNYKLRDWVFSRQRYWGEPIPLVYCENCAKKKQKILLIHGLGGNPQENWFPWFKKQMEDRGFEVITPDLPKPEKLYLKDWLSELGKLGITSNDDLFVVGHSLGGPTACQFILKNNLSVKKLILVAPVGKSSDWQQLKKYDFSDDEIATISRFGEAPIDFAKLRSLVADSVLYFSEDDPYIPLKIKNDYEYLGGSVKIFKDKKHFSSHWGITELPEILEEFPEIDALNTGWVPVEEKDLPVELPKVKKYEPTDTGESPLAAMEKWVKTKCPKCGGEARRETDTMPNWAGSSWYFLRYTDPKNKKEFASGKNLKYWMPVDWYNGGMEHTTLHLLYSRFWYKFLYDIGTIPKECGDEPYKKRTSQGLILGEGGEKMSKSRGNVVNPDDIVARFGADTLRVYEMFMGPFEQAIPWDEKGVVGVKRFLERVWGLNTRISMRMSANKFANSKLERLLHQTIKKVGEDIEAMKFNTAVSALMILTNEMAAQEKLPITNYQLLITLLAPFAPHLAEELWEKIGPASTKIMAGKGKKSIHLEKWPEYDPKLVVEEEIDLIVQINGKMRDSIKVKADISEEEAKKIATESEKVKKWIEGQKIKKVIFVKGRLVNIVV